MRTSRFWLLISAGVAVCATSLPAGAQQGAGNAPPPPQLEKLEEGEEPAITIRQPQQRSHSSETRAPGGKITEIKIVSGGSTYYLKPNDQPGSALAGDGGSGWLRAPQWEVATFDLTRTQEEKEAQARAEAAVPPPPELPAAPAPK